MRVSFRLFHTCFSHDFSSLGLSHRIPNFSFFAIPTFRIELISDNSMVFVLPVGLEIVASRKILVCFIVVLDRRFFT